MTHICVGKLAIIGSDNGLSPGRRQDIIGTNAEILLLGPLGTNFSEILIRIHTLSFSQMDLKISSATWPPFCFGLNVLSTHENYMLATNTNETSMESQYVDIGKPYNRHKAIGGQLSHRLLKSFIRY